MLILPGGKVYTSECDCSDWTEEHACRHVAAAVQLIEQEESDIDMLGGEWPEDIFEEDKPAKKDSKWTVWKTADCMNCCSAVFRK